MLLTIDDIQAELDRAFLPIETLVPGCRLIRKPGSLDALNDCAQRLGVTLPADFKAFALAFDLGNFTVGPIHFGYQVSYPDQLLALNTGMPGWDPEAPPGALILIALSDHYSIMLDTLSGCVLACDQELDWQMATRVAHNFDLFFRGIGTVWVQRLVTQDRAGLAKQVAVAVGSDDDKFWQFLAY